MKKLENKKTSMTNTAKEKHTYGSLIKACVNVLRPQGVTVEEMRSRIKILDAVAKPNAKHFEFSPELIEVIKADVKAYRWAGIHKEVIEFSDYIEKL